MSFRSKTLADLVLRRRRPSGGERRRRRPAKRRRSRLPWMEPTATPRRSWHLRYLSRRTSAADPPRSASRSRAWRAVKGRRRKRRRARAARNHDDLGPCPSSVCTAHSILRVARVPKDQARVASSLASSLFCIRVARGQVEIRVQDPDRRTFFLADGEEGYSVGCEQVEQRQGALRAFQGQCRAARLDSLLSSALSVFTARAALAAPCSCSSPVPGSRGVTAQVSLRLFAGHR